MNKEQATEVLNKLPDMNNEAVKELYIELQGENCSPFAGLLHITEMKKAIADRAMAAAGINFRDDGILVIGGAR